MTRRLAGFLALFAAGGGAAETDYEAARAQVAALGRLSTAPAALAAEGVAAEGGIEPLYYDGLPWKGTPTRVFAWLGRPQNLNDKAPAIVLVHGGGGTAFKEWVRRWNAHGFVALSIAVEGQTDAPNSGGARGAQWQRHAFGGPARTGIYGDSAEPLADQWMYHAVADTILGGVLLRSRPDVDEARVGLMGISWGGVITSTVIGIDPRFAFAIPTYGCGHLADAENQYGRALGENRLYHEVWDPMVRIQAVKMPVLWFSWPGDQHFPLDCQALCYRGAPGPRMVTLRPGMNHSHPAGWNPPESYAFAESVVREGVPWLRQVASRVESSVVRLELTSSKPLDTAVLIASPDSGFTGSRSWTESSAQLQRRGNHYVVTAPLDPATRAWFVNVRSGALIGSSDFNSVSAGK